MLDRNGIGAILANILALKQPESNSTSKHCENCSDQSDSKIEKLQPSMRVCVCVCEP